MNILLFFLLIEKNLYTYSYLLHKAHARKIALAHPHRRLVIEGNLSVALIDDKPNHYFPSTSAPLLYSLISDPKFLFPAAKLKLSVFYG